VVGRQKLAHHQEYSSYNFGGCISVMKRPVTPRLWSGFIAWLLQMVPVAPSRMV
jgi:hypothetical protein